jgi:hypothetical protein
MPRYALPKCLCRSSLPDTSLSLFFSDEKMALGPYFIDYIRREEKYKVLETRKGWSWHPEKNTQQQKRGKSRWFEYSVEQAKPSH